MEQQVGWKHIAGYSDDLDRISYSSRTKEGHIVFGGGSNQSYAYLFNNRTAYPEAPRSAFDKMQETQQQYLPTAKGLPVAHRWTGTLAISLKRNCSVGVMNGNIYYGLGYSGHGVVMANLAGKVIVDIYGKEDSEWRKHEWYNAPFAPIPLEPFRWIGYHGFTRLTGRSPRS
jgi:glycine/D-amino acid oxidase-like deaminating enzyme